jgi:hypothetical protein
VYLPVTKSPPFVPPVKVDGMHYAQHVAMVAADEKLAAGGSRDAARQSMIDAWDREFGSELTWAVDPADKYQFILTDHEQSLVVSVPRVAGYPTWPQYDLPHTRRVFANVPPERIDDLHNARLHAVRYLRAHHPTRELTDFIEGSPGVCRRDPRPSASLSQTTIELSAGRANRGVGWCHIGGVVLHIRGE